MNKLKSIKALILFCTSLVTLISATAFGVVDRNEDILNKALDRDGTVGTVLLYFKNNEPYILLGRETKSDNDNAQGKYSDFGGKVKEGETPIENAVAKLNIETSNILNISKDDYLNKVYTFHKKTDKGRDVFYNIYLVNEEQFGKVIGIPSNVVKDHFIWLPVNNLITSGSGNNIKIKDIDNVEQTITLREYFFKDCIKNPNFKKLLEEISSEKLQN